MRNSYTVEKKLEVIAWHRSNGGVFHKTSQHFGIDRKRVREWIGKESDFIGNDHGSAKKRRCLGSGRKPLSDELDDDLFEFFEEERAAGRIVTNKLLQAKALTIAKKLGMESFKASDRFLNNWKRRFNVVMRVKTNESQKTPEELADEVDAFRRALRECREKNNYTDYNVGNMDQTMVRFDCPSSRTNNLKGETTIRITNTGCAKRGFTVALCARASGHKMPAFCVFKEPSGRIPPRVFANLHIPKNVKVVATNNGWMQAPTMKEWIERIWGENADDVRRLLVLDMARIHNTPDVRSSLKEVDTDVVLIPGGCTRLLQPADVAWNKPFKVKLTEMWMNFMRQNRKTAKGNLQRPNRQNVIDWVSEAWESVSEETVKRSFKMCGITTALDGTENGLFHDNLSTAVKPTSDELEKELVDLLFDDELDTSFYGFSESESE